MEINCAVIFGKGSVTCFFLKKKHFYSSNLNHPGFDFPEKKIEDAEIEKSCLQMNKIDALEKGQLLQRMLKYHDFVFFGFSFCPIYLIYLSIIYIYIYIYLSIHPPSYLSHIHIYLPFHPSTYLFIYIILSISICHLPTYVSMCV